jgi:hypothetical protein
MTKAVAPYTLSELEVIRSAIRNKMRPREIASMFPTRTTRTMFAKIRYERYRMTHAAHRYISSAPDAPSIPDAYAVSSDLANEKQDAKFQDAMRAALQSGRETMPVPQEPHPEFHPAHFDREPGSAFGISPALQCAELGAR